MRRAWILILLALVACSRDVILEDDGQYAPGKIVVKVTPELCAVLESHTGASGRVAVSAVDELRRADDRLGIYRMKRVFAPAGEFEERTRREGLHLWYQIDFDQSYPTSLARPFLKSYPGITLVECDPIRRLDGDVTYAVPAPGASSGPFDDPLFYRQWHFYNDGSREGAEAGCDINIVPAWEAGFTGSPEVIVCVVDGGVDYNHEDLAGNIWYDSEGHCGYNFFSDSYEITPDAHATHVAGTIAAVNNNGTGVCGIAGGDFARGLPGVKIMSCQIFTGNESAGNPAAAIKWGADHGAVISQNSWGYPDLSSTPESVKAAVDYFVKYAGLDASGSQVGPMAGGLVVFAAGNERREASSSSYKGILTVTSLGGGYRKASYSNWGSFADLAAPGGDAPNRVLSTLPDNKYGWMNGTSMACPHVSGVAALVVSVCGGPGFTSADLRRRLESTARPIFLWDEGYYLGHGLVDATAATVGPLHKVGRND
ncbi:MAG: S8 family serine peptidase [Bacteroidales bacterium]|nr:S8 family serine peptidase [Bacteroidales bacterium]